MTSAARYIPAASADRPIRYNVILLGTMRWVQRNVASAFLYRRDSNNRVPVRNQAEATSLAAAGSAGRSGQVTWPLASKAHRHITAKRTGAAVERRKNDELSYPAGFMRTRTTAEDNCASRDRYSSSYTVARHALAGYAVTRQRNTEPIVPQGFCLWYQPTGVFRAVGMSVSDA